MRFPRQIHRATDPGAFVWFAEGDLVTQGTEASRVGGLIGLFPAALYLEHPEAPEVSDVFGAGAAHLAFITQMWVDPAHRGSGAFLTSVRTSRAALRRRAAPSPR